MFRKITTIILFLSSITSFNYNISAQNWDIRTLEVINNNPNRFVKEYSTIISESTAVVAFSVPVALSVTSLITHDDDMLKNALYIGSSLLVDGALTYGFKRAISRPRPYVTYPDIIEPYKMMTSYSMPSGHTSLAFATATSLTLKYPKWYVIAPTYFWACSVGYSRMNLGVHYPSDVIAGAVLGAGSAYLTLLINDWFWKKKDNKKILTLTSYPL
ncbi:MAG: phosphatase PAP2 family protein [Bacteroidales bacterium]|nr:phosphatase PAP2 family protein [Bacteroidales bacterium]